MNGEPEQTIAPAPAAPGKDPSKWRNPPAILAVIVSVCSLGVAIVSAGNTGRSASAALRSADAAQLSAKAALTNADWASYQRNPQHDLIARVLQVNSVLNNPLEDSNSVAYVDLALINNGNQSEIIRRVTLYLDATEDAPYDIVSARTLNSQLPKGDKQVLHLPVTRNLVYSMTNVWIKVGVTAIGTDANDIETKWLAARFSFRPGGAEWSSFATNWVRVVSNERLPHQKTVDQVYY